jgi:hypothetical protein
MWQWAKDTLKITSDVVNFNTEIYHFNLDPRGKPGVEVFQEIRGSTAQNGVVESFGWIKNMPKGGKMMYSAMGHETPEWTANDGWLTKAMYAYMKYLTGDFDKTVYVEPPRIRSEGHSLRINNADTREIQIADTRGRIVASGHGADFDRYILKEGIYFVRVQAAHGKTFSRTVIIK